MKGSSIFIIALTLVGHLTLGQNCPPEEVLLPCRCDEAEPSIRCLAIRGRLNVKEVFDRASPYINDSVIFKKLTITRTGIMELEEGAVEHLKFEEIEINYNDNLEVISPRAFGSRNVTRSIQMRQNYITDVWPRERNIYDFISSFPNLVEVEIQNNLLSSIPDHAFQNLPHLEKASFHGNIIGSIGSRAFEGAPNLKNFTLYSNQMSSGGLPEDAFAGISSSVYFDIRNNNMNSMERASYKMLLDRAANLRVGNFWGFYCDERADWICENREDYSSKLVGFECDKGQADGPADVWEYCAGRNAKVY